MVIYSADDDNHDEGILYESRIAGHAAHTEDGHKELMFPINWRLDTEDGRSRMGVQTKKCSSSKSIRFPVYPTLTGRPASINKHDMYVLVGINILRLSFFSFPTFTVPSSHPLLASFSPPPPQAISRSSPNPPANPTAADIPTSPSPSLSKSTCSSN